MDSWSLILGICLLAAIFLTPVFVLRTYFVHSTRKWLSEHPTLLSALWTWTAWTALVVVALPALLLNQRPPLVGNNTKNPKLSREFNYEMERERARLLEQLDMEKEARETDRPHSGTTQHYVDMERGNTEEGIELALLGLTKGQIAFDVPSQMTEGRTENVQVRIAKGLKQRITNSLKKNLRGTAQVDRIDVVPFMVVKLEGEPSAFSITPLTEEKQMVTASGFNTWAWNVRPTESGLQTLYLSVGTRFKLLGKDEETKFLPIYSRPINVQIDRIYEGQQFVFGNWKWLIATLLIPLGGLIWRAVKKPDA